MNNNTPFTKSISLTDLGIENAKIHYQLSASDLQAQTVALGQGVENSTGALAITGESQDGRHKIDIVKDSITSDKVWGKVNIPFEPAAFDAYISNKEIYVRDSYVCADPNYRLNVE
jgi:phosphoenolpyruvate carboxykinase (ATP)